MKAVDRAAFCRRADSIDENLWKRVKSEYK